METAHLCSFVIDDYARRLFLIEEVTPGHWKGYDFVTGEILNVGIPFVVLS